MNAITKRQREVLDFIEDFIDSKRYSPSFQEIAEGVHLSSLSTVHKHITNLRRNGWLSNPDNNKCIYRSLEVSTPLSMGTRFRIEGNRLWDNKEKIYWIRENINAQI